MEQQNRGNAPKRPQNNNRRGNTPPPRNSDIGGQVSYWSRKIWNNYVLRNVLLAAAALLILVFVASLVLKVITRHNHYKEVPEFVGLNIVEAQKLARKQGLNISINDSIYVAAFDAGTVLEQNPEKGTNVKSGRNIFITINSTTPKSVEIPYVRGYSLRQAKNILENSGLEIEKIVYVNDMATNYVLDQSFKGRPIRKDTKIKAEVGSGVTLTVGKSSSASAIGMPRLVGLSLHDAKSRLWENGFNVGTITYDEGIEYADRRNAKVYEQSVIQGRNTSLGTSVSLKLTLNAAKTADGVQSSEERGREIAAEQAIADSIAKAQEDLQKMVDSELENSVGSSDDNDDNDFFE